MTLEDFTKVTGKGAVTRGLVQAIIILVLAVYSLVVTVEKKQTDISPMVKEIQSTVNVNSGRILRLETLMDQLHAVPESLAETKVAIDSVKNTVDKIEKKLDTHVEKSK